MQLPTLCWSKCLSSTYTSPFVKAMPAYRRTSILQVLNHDLNETRIRSQLFLHFGPKATGEKDWLQIYKPSISESYRHSMSYTRIETTTPGATSKSVLVSGPLVRPF